MTALLIALIVVAYLWLGVIYVRLVEYDEMPESLEANDLMGLGLCVAAWPVFAALQLLGWLVTWGR